MVQDYVNDINNYNFAFIFVVTIITSLLYPYLYGAIPFPTFRIENSIRAESKTVIFEKKIFKTQHSIHI